jgi:tRNA1(Val) A37 N6-methylase TrmN6
MPQITGLEIQPQLAELSNMSAKANGFDVFLHYKVCDIREKMNDGAGSYDVVVTNPPFSDHDMPSPNGSKKYAHNFQNFNLTAWLSFSLKMLKPKGYIALIHRTEALNEILAAMHNKAGNIQILPLYSKEEQQAKRIIVLAQKGSHGLTSILPPLYTHNNDGAYSAKAQQILREAKGYFEL